MKLDRSKARTTQRIRRQTREYLYLWELLRTTREFLSDNFGKGVPQPKRPKKKPNLVKALK